MRWNRRDLSSDSVMECWREWRRWWEFQADSKEGIEKEWGREDGRSHLDSVHSVHIISGTRYPRFAVWCRLLLSYVCDYHSRRLMPLLCTCAHHNCPCNGVGLWLGWRRVGSAWIWTKPVKEVGPRHLFVFRENFIEVLKFQYYFKKRHKFQNFSN